MDDRFLIYVAAINAKISDFNQYMNHECQIPPLHPERIEEEKNGVKIRHGNWHDWQFPNSEKRGVYFIFGWKASTPSENGLYIGKASFESRIGKRLASWLEPYKYSERYEMNGHGEQYVLDYILTIDLDQLKAGFMASSLEEYLITKLSGEVNLLNGTGNWRRTNSPKVPAQNH